MVPRLAEHLARRYPTRLLRIEEKLGGLPAIRRQGALGMVDALANPVNQYRALARELVTAAREPQPRLQSPVLVVWGARDPFLVAPTMEEWEPFARDVTLRILDGSHWIYREKPDEVNRLIREFLGGAPGLQEARDAH
jgi:pimeloyl-ACP methyl ester carboxylesterase